MLYGVHLTARPADSSASIADALPLRSTVGDGQASIGAAVTTIMPQTTSKR